MKYQEPPIFDKYESLRLLNSNNESDIIDGLLSVVLNSGAYKLSMEKSLKMASHPSEQVQACAIECLGHIARLHQKIDIDTAREILAAGLKSENQTIVGKAESAIDDVSFFLSLDRALFT
ncbi:MAG: hypothetical protein AAF206_29105 [Bacteroidota bacterium]